METSAVGSKLGGWPFHFLLLQNLRRETTAPHGNDSFSLTFLSARLLWCPTLFLHSLLPLLFCPFMTNTKPVWKPFTAVSEVHVFFQVRFLNQLWSTLFVLPLFDSCMFQYACFGLGDSQSKELFWEHQKCSVQYI